VRDGFEKFSQQKIFAEGTNGMSLGQRSETVSPIFIGKWTPSILFSLKERPYRHGQLRRRLGSISQRMLTRTLRNLEATGLIARHVTRSNSVAVEYSLTRLGRTLIAPLRGMCRWAKRHHRDVDAEVYRYGT
jgi:DNA-binding HxlR family transcriptional regulator